MAADRDYYGEESVAAVRKELRECRERCAELTTQKRAMEMAAASLIDAREWGAAVAKALRDLKGS